MMQVQAAPDTSHQMGAVMLQSAPQCVAPAPGGMQIVTTAMQPMTVVARQLNQMQGQPMLCWVMPYPVSQDQQQQGMLQATLSTQCFVAASPQAVQYMSQQPDQSPAAWEVELGGVGPHGVMPLAGMSGSTECIMRPSKSVSRRHNRRIVLLRREGRLLDAISYFQSLPDSERDTWVYNAVLSACERLQKAIRSGVGGFQSDPRCQELLQGRTVWQLALKMLREMQRSNIPCDVVTFSTVISACAQGGRYREAFQLLREMERTGVERNAFTYNAVIAACEKAGLWQASIGLLREMERKGIKGDTVSYGSVMWACAKVGRWREVLSLLSEMTSRNIATNNSAYNAAISACGQSGRWQEAINLLKDMQAAGLECDDASYSACLSVCRKCGRWREALEALQVLGQRGAKGHSYDEALRTCTRAGGAAGPARTPTLESGTPRGQKMMPEPKSVQIDSEDWEDPESCLPPLDAGTTVF
eukprot:TRINITY_DN56306_c0_g1_i1.p1 TRINITY_DN56306_c0_g1~~TRINITY_DN56306_c0_g1_i1.p1  ORF type:complete len:546 (+),score=107.78 TRINITY_DN56306_c0_g1_i1:220-1638(+)